MLEKEKDVQGVAVYAEWAKPDALMQVIITPDGYTETNEFVQASMYRRIITTENPKKQWRASFLANDKSDEYGTEMPLLNEEKQGYAENRMGKAAQWFDKMILGDWKIVKEPLLIEVSKKDMEDISLSKTPSKFMYRVELVRKSLDFPQPLKKDEE
jgi:hypothetical protein